MIEGEFNNLYNEWWQNRLPDDFTLHSKVLEYEDDYFEDMRFEPSSILKDYLTFSSVR